MRAPYPRPLPPSGAWPVCRPHPAVFAVLLPAAAFALCYFGTQDAERIQLIGVAAGLVTCLGITLPARVHLRAQTPLPGRRKDGALVVINEGPGVHTLIARVREPEAQLHRDISLTYMLAPGIILPLSALLIAGSLAGYDDLLLGGLYGLVAGLLFTLSLRHLRATWWALRNRGRVLDPRTVAPLLAAHAEVHGDHTVYGGVSAEEVDATLLANPELAANAAEVCTYFGGRRGRWPGHGADNGINGDARPRLGPVGGRPTGGPMPGSAIGAPFTIGQQPIGQQFTGQQFTSRLGPGRPAQRIPRPVPTNRPPHGPPPAMPAPNPPPSKGRPGSGYGEPPPLPRSGPKRPAGGPAMPPPDKPAPGKQPPAAPGPGTSSADQSGPPGETPPPEESSPPGETSPPEESGPPGQPGPPPRKPRPRGPKR